MNIVIKRIIKDSKFTIGNLIVDDYYMCDTLEDTDRGLKQSMDLCEIKSKKIYGDTAIPSGTYEVDMDTVSPKYSSKSWASCCNGKLPRLKNVKGYEGVLIHVGNSSKDTLGCILVGKYSGGDTISNSVVTFETLYKAMKKAYDDGETIILTIQ